MVYSLERLYMYNIYSCGNIFDKFYFIIYISSPFDEGKCGQVNSSLLSVDKTQLNKLPIYIYLYTYVYTE